VEHVVGSVSGIRVGDAFPDRAALKQARVHERASRGRGVGIAGNRATGAVAIVLNGGYEDDCDSGDVVIYTGEGGNADGRQVRDQKLLLGNSWLAASHDDQVPVRGVRGPRAEWKPPAEGYRYDGLYRVERWWPDPGKSGYRVYRYLLVRSDAELLPPFVPGPAPRTRTTGERIVRDTLRARRVKKWHDWTCQVCGVQLVTQSGPYAVSAHIRPLGRPDDGPDHESNMLCLCPNDHVRFDGGAIVVSDDFNVIEVATGATVGRLRTKRQHQIDVEHLRYHRSRWTDA